MEIIRGTPEMDELLAKLRKDLADGHKRLWLWLSDHPTRDKKSWPGWGEWLSYIEGEYGDIEVASVSSLAGGLLRPDFNLWCFGCMWSVVLRYIVGHDVLERTGISCCQHLCLLDWTDGPFCDAIHSVYSRWYNIQESDYAPFTMSDLMMRHDLAKQIAELPLKEMPKLVWGEVDTDGDD
jgi:hypothetical protein